MSTCDQIVREMLEIGGRGQGGRNRFELALLQQLSRVFGGQDSGITVSRIQ